LVYFTSPFREAVDILRSINYKFIFYGLDKDDRKDNIIFKKASRKGFLNDLSGCSGVMANTGFSLISEALYLKKPYLAWPVQDQFEQSFNAYWIDKLGYGKYWHKFNKERIEAFLFNLPVYRKNLKKYKSEDNKRIFVKVDQLVKKYTGDP